MKTVKRNKPATLDVLIRSGSIGRDRLEELRTSFRAGGYDPKVSFTTKKKLLKRLVVSLNADDGFISVGGLNVMRSIASTIGFRGLVVWRLVMTVVRRTLFYQDS